MKGALLASMGTLGCHMGASVGPAPALKALGASGILLLLAIGMGTPSRLCATAGQATQDYGVTLVPLGTLEIHQGQVAGANHVNAVGTLTLRTPMPVILAPGNAYAVYTTQKGHAVHTASLASTGRLPDRAVIAAPATFWVQIASNAHLLTSATVIQAMGSARASPMSKALAVTAVPPTFGISPAVVAASLVAAT